ncbi:MAG: winged helix-turn-helix transcriptional regulator [Saprospiraceae bacterium]|jgi:biotin operon repressor|nr:winged helix-turn-helix transcriptional regulator [Saprospiraceae bacterium]
MIKKSILRLLAENGELSVKEMVDRLEVSKQAIHIAINQLMEKGTVIKLGRAPKTVYRLAELPTHALQEHVNLPSETLEILDNRFLLIDELGKMMTGLEGFSQWCRQRDLPIKKTADEYLKTLEKYAIYYDENGIIDGMPKLLNTKGYEKLHLNALFYLDFYAIERFGKTRLGTLLHYAKQGQNKFLMKMLVAELMPKLTLLMKKNSFDAIGFVPPTIRREVQLMKYLETHLHINLPKVKIQKISGIIPVPQKSLGKMEERIRNAEHTFAVSETIRYSRVLLLDDAVGSGATLNQIAGKLKQKGIAESVTGLAIVGSFKGFDVITDV